MNRTFLLTALTATVLLAGSVPPATGDWLGTLNVGSASLRLLMHLSKDDNGQYRATMDSIDQQATGIAVQSVSLHDRNIHLSVPAVNGVYDGTVTADGTAIDGTWTQG